MAGLIVLKEKKKLNLTLSIEMVGKNSKLLKNYKLYEFAHSTVDNLYLLSNIKKWLTFFIEMNLRM